MSRTFVRITRPGATIESGSGVRAIVVATIPSGGVVIGWAYPHETEADLIAEYRGTLGGRKRERAKRLTSGRRGEHNSGTS